VQFPQKFDGINKSDQYANQNIFFFNVRITPFLYHPQVPLERMSLVKKIFLINSRLE
jgi:hypothetical protein